MSNEESRTDADAAMDRYANGDASAFLLLYDALAPRLYRYLLRGCREPAVASALLRRTLLHLHRARGTYRRGAAVVPWVYALARVSRLEQERAVAVDSARGLAVARFGPTGSVTATSSYRPSALERDLMKLSEELRTPYELVRLEGLAASEAAEMLGWTEESVRLRLAMAESALGDQ